MYFWNSYPFIRLSIALILGIVLHEHAPELWKQHKLVLPILIALTSISTIASHKLGFYKLRLSNGFLALLTILFTGGYQANLIYHSHGKSHYTHYYTEIEGFSGTISSPVNERKNHYRYDLELRSIIGDSATLSHGTIHLYVRKDSSLVPPFSYGDEVFVKGSFYPIPGPDNPKEFNYKKYLERQNIYAHAFVKYPEVKVIGNTPLNRLFGFAFSLRSRAVQIIDDNIPEKRENAISKALLVGIKDFLDNDIKQAYASAGAMHVLAVSGLHVGIIYLLLTNYLAN